MPACAHRPGCYDSGQRPHRARRHPQPCDTRECSGSGSGTEKQICSLSVREFHPVKPLKPASGARERGSQGGYVHIARFVEAACRGVVIKAEPHNGGLILPLVRNHLLFDVVLRNGLAVAGHQDHLCQRDPILASRPLQLNAQAAHIACTKGCGIVVCLEPLGQSVR